MKDTVMMRVKKVTALVRWNKRQLTITSMMIIILLLMGLMMSGLFIDPQNPKVNLDVRNSSPSLQHLFGTDWLGRDMLVRTLKGLTLSFWVGIIAAFSSTLIALFFSLLASWNKKADLIITWLIDLFLSVPHIVMLILISFALGGGFKGVIFGLALTHWPSLTRLIRAELLQLKTAEYVTISRKLGKSYVWVARHHFLPYLIPQLLVGFILLFPHAILHEAAITFLGFGLPSEQPAIGIILSESMRYLSTGMWWLAFFPGLSLLIMIGLFDRLGETMKRLIHPTHNEK